MSIYSNDNIRKIAKLTTRELPQKSKNAKITVRENNGLYSCLKNLLKGILYSGIHDLYITLTYCYISHYHIYFGVCVVVVVVV